MHGAKRRRPKYPPGAQTSAPAVKSSPATGQGGTYPARFPPIRGEFTSNGQPLPRTYPWGGVLGERSHHLRKVTLRATKSCLRPKKLNDACHVSQASEPKLFHEVCAPAARSERSELCFQVWRFQRCSAIACTRGAGDLCSSYRQLKGGVLRSELDREP